MCGGVAIVTASIPPVARARRRASCTRARPRTVRLGLPSCRDRDPRARAPRNRAARSARTCVRQPNPVPTTATPVVTPGSPPRSRPSTASCTDPRRTGSRPAPAGRSARRARAQVAVGDVTIEMQLVGRAPAAPARSRSTSRLDRLRDQRGSRRRSAPPARAYSACSTHSNSEPAVRTRRAGRGARGRGAGARRSTRARPPIRETGSSRFGLAGEHSHRAGGLTTRRRDQGQQLGGVGTQLTGERDGKTRGVGSGVEHLNRCSDTRVTRRTGPVRRTPSSLRRARTASSKSSRHRRSRGCGTTCPGRNRRPNRCPGW